MKNFNYIILISILFFVFTPKIFGQKKILVDENEYYDLKKMEEKVNSFGEVDSVRIEMRDLAYACGECYPRYLIEKVYFCNSEDIFQYYNKEIYVEFIGEELKKQRKKMTCPSTRYKYILYGRLSQNGYGIMKLEALGGKIIADDECFEKPFFQKLYNYLRSLSN